MPLRFEILKKTAVPTGGVAQRFRKTAAAGAEFFKRTGRKPTDAEAKELAEKVWNMHSYSGICPACRVNTCMYERSKKSGKLFISLLIRTAGISILKPLDMAKRILSTQKQPDSCVCSECDGVLVVCPTCVAAIAVAHLNISQELYCPSCNTYLG